MTGRATSNRVPFYDADGVTIYNDDAAAIVGRLPGEWIMVTDPPYGELGYDWDTRPDWAVMPLRGSGITTAVVFGHQPHLSREILPAMEAAGLPFRYEWVWEKPIGRLWNHQRPIRRHELAWCFGALDGSDLRAGFGGQHDSIISAISFQAYMRAHPEATGHPTQKPLALMQAIIASLPEGAILDPYMGSGSTLVAARNLGRRAVGVEISTEFCAIARSRFGQMTLGASA